MNNSLAYQRLTAAVFQRVAVGDGAYEKVEHDCEIYCGILGQHFNADAQLTEAQAYQLADFIVTHFDEVRRKVAERLPYLMTLQIATFINSCKA